MADTPETAFDPADPLARCELDTARSHAALLDYWRMGAGRSLPRLAEKYKTWGEHGVGKPPTRQEATLCVWSSRGQWQARVAAQVEIERKQFDAALAEKRIQIAKDDIEDADGLRALARQILAEGPKFLKHRRVKGKDGQPDIVYVALDSHALVSAEKLASDLARRAAGMKDVQQIDLTNKGQAFETPVLYLPAVSEDGNGQSAELEAEQPTAGAVSSDASIRGAVRRRGRGRKE